jgi:hypothetical protein
LKNIYRSDKIKKQEIREWFMRKYSWLIVLLVITSKINAQNIFTFNWDFGSIGFGMDYSSNDDDNIEITVSVLNLIIEHYYSNAGFGQGLGKNRPGIPKNSPRIF